MQIGHSVVRCLEESSQGHGCGGFHACDGRKRGCSAADTLP
jgi:hypothetical protein